MSAPGADVPVVEGEVLADKYRIERILGRGGMGVVVAATHVRLEQRYAIKFLLAHATGEIVERFLREARAAVKLKSQHVAKVHDVSTLPNGAPYMVMEYLEGDDLSNVLRQGGPLPIEEAVEYVLHACEAIAEAHSLGIIHRDLKPANLFLTKAADGTKTVKVLDFGISKAAGDDPTGASEMALTRTTAVLGSPLYMSPEQMKSARTVDARSDIWSMGAILYQLITGHVPFEAMTYPELILMVAGQDPPSPRVYRPDVPPELEAAMLRCLTKDVSQRFANMAELAWAIAPFAPAHAVPSAERASRTLGVPHAPQAEAYRASLTSGIPPRPGSQTNPFASGPVSQPGSVSASPSGPGSATGAAGQQTGSGAMVPATTAAAWSGSTAGAGQPPKRGGTGIVIAAAVATLLVAAGGVLLVGRMLKGNEVTSDATSATSEVKAPSSPSATPPPPIEPASAKSADVAAPTEPPAPAAPPLTSAAVQAPPAASGAAPPAVKPGAPQAGAAKASATPPAAPQPPAAATTAPKKNNPLDALGDIR